jgi:hypothetical protein
MTKSPKKKPKVREDLNTLAARIVAEATGAKPKTPDPKAGRNAAAVALGKLGAAKGGKARKKKLPAERRAEIARRAAAARWKKR